MKKQIFSKIMIIAIAVLSSIVQATNIYLKNDTGYSLIFKFGTPSQKAKEYPLNREFLFRYDDIDSFVQDISIARSGYLSTFSPWTQLDINELKEKTKRNVEDFTNRELGSMILRDIDWVITAEGLGWKVEPKGTMVPKK